VLNAADPRLAAFGLPPSLVICSTTDGWHLRDSELFHGRHRVMDTRVPCRAAHRMNLCAARRARRLA
jgi:hypothetical protein